MSVKCKKSNRVQANVSATDNSQKIVHTVEFCFTRPKNIKHFDNLGLRLLKKMQFERVAVCERLGALKNLIRQSFGEEDCQSSDCDCDFDLSKSISRNISLPREPPFREEQLHERFVLGVEFCLEFAVFLEPPFEKNLHEKLATERL